MDTQHCIYYYSYKTCCIFSGETLLEEFDNDTILNINLTCFFSSADASATAWFKQTPGEKPLLIASVFRSAPVTYHNGFNKSGRFNAVREKSSFNLSISNAEPSDSATYYCAVAYYTDISLMDCTVFVLKGSLNPKSFYPVELGGNTTLQCSILTDASAGDHSVYWFRHGSGESHPGIIYTHGNRSGECEKSSETDSPTQSCVYKLPKRNLSLSDAGTYYCAVLMCGQIIFGNGTKLDFVVALSLTCALRKPVTAMSHLKDLKNIWLGNTHPILILCTVLHFRRNYSTFAERFIVGDLRKVATAELKLKAEQSKSVFSFILFSLC
uniref:Ig-like domain-containing protein n=1 Tax=Pygocentrus nattereri TaxID=42514 RepID=A0A3B4D025_PYGNA